MISITYFNIANFSLSQFNLGLQMLSEKMRLEVLACKFDKDRFQKLAARLMLLNELQNIGYQKDIFNLWKRDMNNKPFIGSKFHFNFAHSDQLVIMCFSKEAEVGIDIEKIDTQIDYKSLSSYFCKEEQVWILESEHSISRFFEIWTKKESVLKANGIGIVEGLKKVDCLTNEISIGKKKWYLQPLYIDEHYKSCLASTYENIEFNICEIRKFPYEFFKGE